MIALIVFLALVAAFLIALFWYVVHTTPNREPAIGTNRPYPDGVGPLGAGADEPPHLPTAVISEAEAFRRGAGHRLARMFRKTSRDGIGGTRARSWMDEPGAMEAAGLVDAPDNTNERRSHLAGAPFESHRRPARRKHRGR